MTTKYSPVLLTFIGIYLEFIVIIDYQKKIIFPDITCLTSTPGMSLQKSERNAVVKFLGSNWKTVLGSFGNKMLIFI